MIMGNVKGKNKENNDTTSNKPVKAEPKDNHIGGIFVEKAIAIRKLILELLSKRKEQEETE